MEVWAIVPARLNSRRLSGKALLPILGQPLVAHVLQRAASAQVHRVVLATDDDAIEAVGRDLGHEVIRTQAAASGTERCWQALQELTGRPDVVVNVQGDQPLLNPLHIDAAVAMLSRFDVGTVCAPLADGDDPAQVKVVTSHDERALYFSRAPIPHGGPYRVHVGVYAFSVAALSRCAGAPRGGLAAQEDLEQLAWLQAGITIGVANVEHASEAVDDEAGLERVRAILAG